MSVKTTQTTIYECDRCGHQTERPMSGGNYTNLTVDETYTMYDGAISGHKRDLWLCANCSHLLSDFLKGVAVAARPQ